MSLAEKQDIHIDTSEKIMNGWTLKIYQGMVFTSASEHNVVWGTEKLKYFGLDFY